MSKFKVGDRVKCISSIDEENGGPKEGEFYTITAIDSGWIGFVIPTYTNNRSGYGTLIQKGAANWGEQYFKLVEKEKRIPLFYHEETN